MRNTVVYPVVGLTVLILLGMTNMNCKVMLQIIFLLLSSFAFNTSWAAKSENPIKLLALSGSTRSESVNKKALMLLGEELKRQGAVVTYIDLSDYTLPIYNGDLEVNQGIPENAKKLQDLIASHDGLLIASPEYNGLPSPLLINSIDWASREIAGKKDSGVKIFQGKTAALIAASPGKSGGNRGLSVLAQFLSNIGVKVIPEQTTIPEAFQAFDAQGQLKNKVLSQNITSEAKALILTIKRSKL